ncbi:hypothetical protein DPMN_171841 [Dreissena polymorpha]|uniref:Uncharacterized protein n=1 Tax=Dreissena polymorpha TaxID=45954 RepID=A0A9D4IEJ0_DREPO|nr:hypothetical protein DPMN_171841 [Dreissena polymorpha]
MHGPITNPGAPLGQTCGVGIRVGLCRAISSFLLLQDLMSGQVTRAMQLFLKDSLVVIIYVYNTGTTNY